MEIIFDTHTHTTISDGANSPEEMLRAAAARGMKVLALTDHFDIHDRFPLPLSKFDGAGRESSYELLTDLKQQDLGIKFIKGVEIGQAHQYKDVAENWLSSHDYDYVLASCHIVRGQRDFYGMDYSKNSPDKLLKQYFEELIELCSWGGENKLIDALAHLTYPLRYMKGNPSLSGHKAAIDELFTVMAKYEIALEINTGSVIPCPEFSQVKRFFELGGRLITIGSDSHSTGSIGVGVGKGIEIARAAGFTECVYYERRAPKFIKL